MTAARNIALLALIGCASGLPDPSPMVRKPGPAASPCGEVPRLHRLTIAPDGPRDFDRAQAVFARARARSQLGNHPQALPLYEEAVRLDPTFGFAHLGLARSQLLMGSDRDAMLGHAATATALLPDNPRAHHLLAKVLDERGATRPARTHLLCALELRPSLHEARADLAVLQLDAEAYAEAGSTLEELIRRQGSEVQTQVLLARAYAGMKRWADAGQAMEAAARQAGRNAVLLRRAAQLYEQGGLEQRAATVRMRADAIDPPPENRNLRPLRPSRR
ncbi:MAG: hypothetical protein AAGD10_21735 [Myxococcota bacterium]